MHFSLPPAMDLNSLGLFGDSFNVLTSLFTGLAFAGVIVSVILQTQELKEASQIFKEQKETLDLQQKEMVIQSFDNKFFQMLNLFNQTIENLNYNRYKGKEVLSYLKTTITSEIIEKEIKHLDSFQTLFNDINNNFDTTFKYYFINLYQLLNYCDSHFGSEQEAKKYTNIIRAQLSKNELVLLFYNAIGVIKYSGIKYKLLVEKYSFFEHLRYDDLKYSTYNTFSDLLILEYKETSFGKNDPLIQKRQEIIDQQLV